MEPKQPDPVEQVLDVVTSELLKTKLGKQATTAVDYAADVVDALTREFGKPILAILENGEWVYEDDRITVVDMVYVRGERDAETIQNYLQMFRQAGGHDDYVTELEELLAEIAQEEAEGGFAFEAVAERQGWTDNTQLDLLLEFVQARHLTEDLGRYARQRADENRRERGDD